jgi:hypothetical protein
LINAEELAICKKRGHDTRFSLASEQWDQCKWCGTWLRKVSTIEEREDEPPDSEQSPLVRLRKAQ